MSETKQPVPITEHVLETLPGGMGFTVRAALTLAEGRTSGGSDLLIQLAEYFETLSTALDGSEEGDAATALAEASGSIARSALELSSRVAAFRSQILAG